jgi:multicomponent Na+:H+ antiporter subunit C
MDEIAARFPFWAIAALLAIGLYGTMGKRSLVKKLIGLNIFQSAIILFFIAGSLKTGATVPILLHGEEANASAYLNPLPHVLMLTAIVVSVAVTGVALSFLVRIHREFRDADEETVLDELGRMS